jgi:Galactose oxidase, central domain
MGEVEIFGYYFYFSRSIPEGREQFSFVNDLNDIVIFGGSGLKSLNDTWIFNSSKYTINKKVVLNG